MILTVPAVLGPGRVFFAGAWGALRTRAVHLDLPIAIALGAGFTRGAINTWSDSGPIYFDGVCVLIFLLLIGRYLQLRGQRAATDASELLYSLTPNGARIIDDSGRTREIPAAALIPGMVLDVRSGDVPAADGVVIAGASAVDLSLLTGESRPVSVSEGSSVFAGTLNVSSPIRVRIERAGEESRVARILRQVEESARRRAPIVLFANRIAGRFVAIVLALAIATFVVWLRFDASRAFDNAIALLVVTCPCALAMATPLAVTVASGRAARRGIFVKGGEALESLSRAGTLFLDKTGTITEARTSLVDWDGDTSIQALVLALESESTHPLADGFRRAFEGVERLPVEWSQHVVGGGIIGRVAGHDVVIGSPAFVSSHVTSSSADTDLWLKGNDETLTPVYIAIDGALRARAALGDPIRSDARASIDALRGIGWDVFILSGDASSVVHAVGRALGIDSAHCIGDASPEEKLRRVEKARTLGRVVMVGDGVNDAAAIAAATVGSGVHGEPKRRLRAPTRT
ncbi:MAG: cation-translocating P-type ATPase [Gemmatimonadaceae bacterium]